MAPDAGRSGLTTIYIHCSTKEGVDLICRAVFSSNLIDMNVGMLLLRCITKLTLVEEMTPTPLQHIRKKFLTPFY